MKNRHFLVIGLLLLTSIVVGQPCLDDWLYRKEVSVTSVNSGILYNHQIKVTVNTSDLVTNGKARVDGGDIRFTNSTGSVLSFWYDPSTYNTTSTDFWIKVDQVPNGTSSIYLFYGNSTSANISSGEATFEFFDNFDTGDFAPLKWEKCGDNSNFSVTGAVASYSSTLTNSSGTTKSVNTYSNVIAEAKVNSASNGRGVLGLVDASGYGYATVYEANPSAVMKMMKVAPGTTCENFSQLTSPMTTAAGTINGIWSFKWPTSTTQEIEWPSGSTAYSETGNAAYQGNPMRVIIGSTLNQATSNGNLTVDWVRLRKYCDTDPSTTVGIEYESPVDPNPINSGPYCGGETVELFSTAYSGAVYSWTGPSGFTSSSQNPTIPSSVASSHAGTYYLTVSMPSGCNSVSLSTEVEISSASVGGTLTGSTTLCSGYNSGTVNLSGITGDILRWEMSSSSGGPWINLANTTTSTSYQNLEDTTYYRAVVQNGSCAEDYSSVVEIDVTEPTVPGFVLGTTAVCEGSNAGDLTLAYEQGNVIKWEYSEDNGASWTNITNSTNTQSYLNLTNTRIYRAQVQNGVCPAQYSDEATITVNPNPVASFTATSVCEGNNTSFTNTSSGTIASYSWNFGNGSGSISQNPVYLYSSDGNYAVELSVTTDKGCSNTVNNLVQVYPLPSVGINQVDVCQGSPMNFQAVASVSGGSVSNYDWTLGDGNTSTAANPSHTYSAAGTYDVTLIITSNNSCVDSANTEVEVGAPASVSFISDSVCLGESISFINTTSSSSSSVTYSWDFGDGGSSSLYSPTYTYAAVGAYTVTLQAQVSGGTSGCVASTQRAVKIYEVPSVDFSYTNVCQSDSAVFTNLTSYTSGLSSMTFDWDFGDGYTSSLESPKHKYLTPTNYSVELTGTTTNGCTNAKDYIVSIYNMPTANFSYADVCLGSLMNFTSSSSIPTGTLSYDWDFDDATTATVENPVHLYSLDQSYDVELIVTSNYNCTDTVVKTVNVYPLPVVKFGVDPVCDGISSVFSDSSSVSSGFITNYNWDFSDGSSSTSQNPGHLFLNVGNYNVTLSTTTDHGCVNDTTQVVTVNPLPVANFDITDACLGASVSFDNTSAIQFGSLTYNWDFGDGNTSTSTDPQHLYGLMGLFPVKLVATSSESCVDSLIKYAEVFALPNVDAGVDTSVSQGFSIQLDGYNSAAVSYSWTPSSTLDNSFIYNPEATPLETTTYKLLIVDDNGCKNADTVVVEVLEDYSLYIHNIITPDGNGQNDVWKITNIETFESANVYIYDRWGSEVLKVEGYQNDWEGVKGTDQLPDGTYYYMIEFDDSDKVYKGSLTVLRNK